MKTSLHAPSVRPGASRFASAPAAWLAEAFALFASALLAPSKWRSRVARAEPSLRPDFGFVDLTQDMRRSPAVRRLLGQLLVSGGLTMGLVTIALLGGGAATGSHALTAAAYGMGLGLSGTMLTGAVLSVAGAMWGGVLIAAAFGLACRAALDAAGGPGMLAAALGGLDAATRVAGGLAAAAPPPPLVGAAISVSIGFAGYMVGAVREDSESSFGRQAGAVVLGTGTCLLTHGGAVALALLLAGATEHGWIVAAGFGTIVACAAGVALRLQATSSRRAATIGAAIGIVHLTGIGLFPAAEAPVARLALGGAATAVFYSVLFVLAFVLADRLGGRWAGATASAIGSGTAFVLFVAVGTGIPMWPAVPLALLGNAAGLTVAVWLPLLLYPFEVAANLVLLRVENARPPGRPTLIGLNAVFWDELQWIPLGGLDEHLLLAVRRDADAGLGALEQVAATRQRRAAQSARVELDARVLDACTSFAGIAEVPRRLASGEIPGAANVLLRGFLAVSESAAVALRQSNLFDQELHVIGIERRLEDLAQDLTRNPFPGRRFLPIAARWRAIVRDHHAQLRRMLEERQEIRNPYVRGMPLTEEQEIFVGRGAVGSHIAHLVLGNSRTALLLYGQRRMGKTSLLNRLGRLLPRGVVPMFVDLQGLAASRTAEGFLAGMARSMIESARRHRGLTLEPLSRSSLARDPFAAFDEWLDRVEQDLGAAAGLLVLDEFEALGAALRDGHLDPRDVLGMFRHVIQHRRRLTVLLAGSHTLDEIQGWATYLVNVQTIHLGFLEPEETLQLVERPVADFSLVYEPAASQRVLTLTRGHPHLVQLLCYAIVALKNAQATERRRRATLSDVHAVVPEALASGTMLFLDIANQIGEAGIAIMDHFGRRGEGEPVSRATLAAIVPGDQLDDVLTLLTRRELVEAADGGYRCQVELVRRWFAGGRSRDDGGLQPPYEDTTSRTVA